MDTEDLSNEFVLLEICLYSKKIFKVIVTDSELFIKLIYISVC